MAIVVDILKRSAGTVLQDPEVCVCLEEGGSGLVGRRVEGVEIQYHQTNSSRRNYSLFLAHQSEAAWFY